MKFCFRIFLLITIVTTSLLSLEVIKSKNIYIDYLSYPKRVFTGQKFEIVLKATILINQEKYDKIITTFEGEDNIELPEVTPIWNKDKDNIFISNIRFKSKDKKEENPRNPKRRKDKPEDEQKEPRRRSNRSRNRSRRRD